LRSALALALPSAAATRVVARMGWVLGAVCLLLATSAGRLWGEPIAISLLLTGATAILGAGAEVSFEQNQSALQAISVRAAVRQPTFYLQPAEALTPVLLSAIESIHWPALPVVSETRLVGVVTRRDLASARKQPVPLMVSDVLRSDFVQVEADADLWRAQHFRLGAGQEALPVVDGEHLYGMLTSADIRAAFVAPPSPIAGEAPQLTSPTLASL
jgi:CBS domain-containing protein